MKMTCDLQARQLLRDLRDFSEANGRLPALSSAHMDLAHMTIVMFCGGTRPAQRIGRCLGVLRGHRARILLSLYYPTPAGYTDPIANMVRIDNMIFSLEIRRDVAAASEAIETVIGAK